MTSANINPEFNNQVSNQSEDFVSKMPLKDFRQCHVGAPRFATYQYGDKVKQGVEFAKPAGGYTFVAFSEKCGALSADELKAGFRGEGNLWVGENDKGFHYFYRSKVTRTIGEVIE